MAPMHIINNTYIEINTSIQYTYFNNIKGKTMKKIFLLITIMSLIIIQCGNKTDNQTTSNNNVNTNEAVQSNETIPAAKILSEEDTAFLDKVKNKIIISGMAKYTFKDNGDIEYVYDSGSYREDKMSIGRMTLSYAL